MTIKDFNINEALNGASIGFIVGSEVTQYIIDFKKSGSNVAKKEYQGVGQDNKKVYYFDNKGYCSDFQEDNRLFRIIDEIKFTEGTSGSRGDAEGGAVTIDYMQPRDQFAVSAMQSIINRIDSSILGIDDFKIGKICDLSYRIAQKMMDTSAKYRELAKEGETESPYIDIDKETLTENTDKILYNIQTVLRG